MKTNINLADRDEAIVFIKSMVEVFDIDAYEIYSDAYLKEGSR